ncbi:phage tail tape measure protein, partial [Candidatus Darwinibacter acetoxidans]
MAKIKGITVQIGADTKGLEAALKDVNQTAGKLRSELREVERLLKFNPRDTELLAQKQKLLTDQVENTRAKLQQLRDVQEQVNEQFKKGEIGEEQYRAFQRELIKTESQLKEYEKALKEVNLQNHEFNQKMQEMGDKLKKAGESMVATGKTLSTHLTVPLTALGTLAAKSAIDFESAFAGVRKTVDATEEEFAALERGIRDMAKEIPAAATEIAGVAEAAGQLGIQNEHILSFTRTMIDLGESTNMSAEQAATALARLANITQMPQSEFDRLGSTIVALGNNLATTEAEIVEMSLRLAGAGKQVGMTEAEILSFAGALSSVGIAAEAGGSAFSKVMIQMQLAAETGGAALDNFARVAGMSAEQFARQFRENAAEALIAFINGLQRAQEEGTSAIKVLDDMGITEVRMRDALLRAAGAGELFAESIKLGTEAWEENVALATEAEQRYKTTESQLAIMRNKLQEVAITFGEILLPPLMSVVEKIGEFANWLADLDPNILRIIVVVGGLAAVLGPVLIIVGQVVSSIGTLMPILGTLAAFITKTLIPAITSISLPAVATVGAIAALAAVAYEVYRAWDEVKAALSATWEYMKASAEKLALNMSLSFEKMKVTVIGVVDEILERLSILESLPFGIGESFAGLREKVSGSVDASTQKIAELEAALEANSVRMAEAAEDMKVSWGDVGAKVAEDIQLVIDKITGQTEIMAAELDEQTEIVGQEQDAQTEIILDAIDTRIAAISDGESTITGIIEDESEKQKDAREKFEEEWNQRLFNLQATRREKLQAEYDAAIELAKKLEADTAAIHEYYRILLDQMDEEGQKAKEERLKAWRERLKEATASELDLLALQRDRQLALIEEQMQEELELAGDNEEAKTQIMQFWALKRQQVLGEYADAVKAIQEREAEWLQSLEDRLIEATATEEELLAYR